MMPRTLVAYYIPHLEACMMPRTLDPGAYFGPYHMLRLGSILGCKTMTSLW